MQEHTDLGHAGSIDLMRLLILTESGPASEPLKSPTVITIGVVTVHVKIGAGSQTPYAQFRWPYSDNSSAGLSVENC